MDEAMTDNRVRLRSLRTGKVIPHLININKLKRAYCEEGEEVAQDVNEEEEEQEQPVRQVEDPEVEEVEEEDEVQVRKIRTHTDSTEQRMSEESSTGESQSESESEREKKKQEKEIIGRTGTKGGRYSQKVRGANTPENETRQEGWEPPGNESDHADRGHTHKASMPLARKRLARKDEDLGEKPAESAEMERATTTPWSLRSHPVDPSGRKPTNSGPTKDG